MVETLLLYDDGGGALAPLTDLRASFELRTAALTTAERLQRQTGLAAGGCIVPNELAGVVSTRTHLPINRLPDGDSFILLNGRCVSLSFELPRTELNVALIDGHGSIIAARLDRKLAEELIATRECPDELDCQLFSPIDPDDPTATNTPTPMIERPWDLLHRFDELLAVDLDLLAGEGSRVHGDTLTPCIGDHPVMVGERVVLHPNVVFDATDGPIHLADEVEVHAHSVIKGPCYVGHGTRLNYHTALSHSAVGPVCKIGGEVSGSVIQGYSNKGHYGYLGDSIVGEWVNLGAGTTTSNLKNTYGVIRAVPHSEAAPQATGLRFFGSILGDHVKTGIGTMLSTGSIIHTGSMVAMSSFPPKCVPPFMFLTDQGQEPYELEKFAAVAHRAMQRRGMMVNADLAHRFAGLHARGLTTPVPA